MALRERVVVDLARRLEREAVDVPDQERVRVQTEASRHFPAQFVRRDRAALRAPQYDLLSAVDDGYGSVGTRGGLDLVEVHTEPVDLGDPLRAAGKPKE